MVHFTDLHQKKKKENLLSNTLSVSGRYRLMLQQLRLVAPFPSPEILSLCSEQ